MQVSCTSSTFSSVAQPPNYFQLFPAESDLFLGWILICKQYGWRQINVIFQDKSPFSSVSYNVDCFVYCVFIISIFSNYKPFCCLYAQNMGSHVTLLPQGNITIHSVTYQSSQGIVSILDELLVGQKL